jgi:hypothetical protein
MRLKTTILLLLISASLFALSQESKTVSVEKNRFNLVEEMTLKDQMLDTIFYKGRVYFKDGNYTEAYLNYNLLTNSIFFLNDEKKAFQLVGLPEISTIIYGKRTFLPINSKEVAEVIETLNGQVQLLLNRKVEIKNTAEYRGAYGTSTATSSVTRVNAWDDVGAHIPIDRAVNIEISLKSQYLLKKNDKIVPINRIRDLRKIYPDKWEQLKEFVQTNNFKFNNKNDVVSIIKFCNE